MRRALGVCNASSAQARKMFPARQSHAGVCSRREISSRNGGLSRAVCVYLASFKADAEQGAALLGCRPRTSPTTARHELQRRLCTGGRGAKPCQGRRHWSDAHPSHPQCPLCPGLGSPAPAARLGLLRSRGCTSVVGGWWDAPTSGQTCRCGRGQSQT